MRYANVTWQNTELCGKSGIAAINLGDNLQFLGIEYLYKRMGLTRKDLVELCIDEVRSYRGEQLILPLNWPLFDQHFMDGNCLSFSPDIIPVFLAVNFNRGIRDDDCNDFNISYLNRFGPVGCRDEYAYRKLTALGVDAFLNGCVTTILPREKTCGDRVLLADAPIELLPYIPHALLKKAVCSTQQVYLQLPNMRTGVRDITVQHYDEIYRHTELAITSRLHVAAPFMARGIPVIFARRILDTRFEFIDRLLPLHSAEEYGQIDWNPESIEYEETKELIISHDLSMLRREGEDKEARRAIHEFWMARPRREYASYLSSLYHDFRDIFRFLDSRCSKGNVPLRYMLWGVTDTNKALCDEIRSRYPHAELVAVLDSFHAFSYSGLVAQHPEKVDLSGDITILVLSVGASNSARKLLKARGLRQEQYYLQGDCFIEQEDVIQMTDH